MKPPMAMSINVRSAVQWWNGRNATVVMTDLATMNAWMIPVAAKTRSRTCPVIYTVERAAGGAALIVMMRRMTNKGGMT